MQKLDSYRAYGWKGKGKKPNLKQWLIRSNEDVYITIDEIESYYGVI